ncbi:replication initiator protein A [Apilactobacillus apisilvae]|uniref:Replication initiator protein A n=1 Tax=Apilactobacillus apisilvae TaxID=2923364 RepID=A0ABY4PGN0_9LACO|nr:replication initiator protein A [Apilactobacillus apisilvae]UQS84790.1 replication initiator protein A [Apilactobacillus apisilvae]
MKQFIKFDIDLRNDDRLNNDTRLAYAYLYDRMQSSIKRREFFDKKVNAYYVIYTVEEMIKDLGVGRNTVINVYKKLAKLGYVIKKKVFNGATRFFLPHFHDDSADSKPTQVDSSNSNQTNSKQITSKTAVTAEANIHHQNKPVNISEFDLMQNVVDGLKAKAAFEPDLINTLVKYSENAHCLYQYAQLIFKTKKASLKRAIKHGYSEARKALHFETNCYMQSNLVKTMRNLIIQTRTNHKIHNKSAYIAQALYKFFDDVVLDYHDRLDMHEVKDFNIPII